MKNIIFLTTAFILLSACAPSTSQTQAAIPTVDPGLQENLTPTQPPAFAEILGNNDFHQTRNYCSSICTSYELYDPQMVAKVYDSGVFSIQSVADSSGALDLQVLNLVLTQAYGQETTDWVTENLKASLRKEQTGSVGNYDITMSGKANERVMITITPK
jgi:hypothetical protein